MRSDLWERPAEGEGSADRRSRILDAAERCFVRSGFHRTTMQDVAAEAGMSAGNLYRYFRSKGAIVAGLTERDRAEMASDLSVIGAGDDFIAAFRELGRKHFEDEPRERAVLCLEIWAEATRNREVAATAQERFLRKPPVLYVQVASAWRMAGLQSGWDGCGGRASIVAHPLRSTLPAMARSTRGGRPSPCPPRSLRSPRPWPRAAR